MIKINKRKIANHLPFIGRLLYKRLYSNPFKKRNFDDKFIFIHIPRTGGTSISHALYSNDYGHHYLSEYYFFDKEKTKSYFKFAVVRNPWDRLVSSFHQVKRDKNPTVQKLWNELEIKDFDDLINKLNKKKIKE